MAYTTETISHAPGSPRGDSRAGAAAKVGGGDKELSITDVVSRVGILEKNALIKVDRAVGLDGYVVITGWKTNSTGVGAPGLCLCITYRRPDVEQQFGRNSEGFVIVANVRNLDKVEVFFTASGRKFKTIVEPAQDSEAVSMILAEQQPRLPSILPALVKSGRWGNVLYREITNDSTSRAKGHIDMALCVEGAGIAVSGWGISDDPASLYLVAENGRWLELASAEPVMRQDVIDAYGTEFENWSSEPGFYACIQGDILPNTEILLVNVQEDGFFNLAKTEAAQAHASPIEFARRILSEPTPEYSFVERLSRHDLPLIEELISRKNAALQKLPVDRWDFGPYLSRPEASIIVPLYGRWDFVEHQLLEFSADPAFGGYAELIYVIDDPSLVSPFLAAAQELHDLYGVPFSILWGHSNRGYSGANNLAAEKAKGRILIFLNSDAFPNRPGWVSGLVRQLDKNPDYGIVAPRLLLADGGIQHAGICFRYDEGLGTWLNDHPLFGLPPRADTEDRLVERPAVTGACMAVRRDQFIELGGFDPGYLIGDFEDTDLCLKYRGAKLLPGYDPGIELTHLERQSFRGIGGNDFRQKVVIFNAVRHERRWGGTIEKLSAPATQEMEHA
ncbi:MAG: glycosyltransferase [Nisaea sp.]|uniref:glycosyltransferase n=1 Tax=Nisaea sp. TaxID=2024842 RepID=UPI001B1F2CE1|nr:glycosyltransferase [Nisaea sp.]MBO6560813.1 glycosyltransferase [Nisaea sp.]